MNVMRIFCAGTRCLLFEQWSRTKFPNMKLADLCYHGWHEWSGIRVKCDGTRSASMADLRSQVEATVPELLPLWLRHGHKVPEQLAQDLNLGGVRGSIHFKFRPPYRSWCPCTALKWSLGQWGVCKFHSSYCVRCMEWNYRQAEQHATDERTI